MEGWKYEGLLKQIGKIMINVEINAEINADNGREYTLYSSRC